MKLTTKTRRTLRFTKEIGVVFLSELSVLVVVAKNYKLIIKKYFSIVFLFIAVFAQAQSTTNINQRQEDSLVSALKKQFMNKPLPAFNAAGDEGVVNNESIKGKVTFINMWEASCAPCMAEMGALNKLYDTLRYNSDFEFISLSSDDYGTIRKIKEKYHIRFNVAHLSEEGCYQLNEGGGYPTSIIVDEKGNVKYIHWGGYTDSAKIWRFIFSDEIYPEIMREKEKGER